jgi:putative Mg2+ transporter-C (MgtC) family protein
VELLEFTGRTGLAALLGVLIGLERQLHHHPAGPRTNALVSLGAAMFVSLTPLLGDTNSPSRIASYVVSGIGFLGGGAIIKEGANVRGLTTAAVLWCSAAVGALCGAGHAPYAATGAGLVMGVLLLLRPLVVWIDKHHQRLEVAAAYRLDVICDSATHALVRATLDQHFANTPGFRLTKVKTSKSKRRKSLLIHAELIANPVNDAAVQEAVAKLLAEPGVQSASWEKLPHAPE